MEPVYVERAEAAHVVEQFSPERRRVIAGKVRTWWDNFFSQKLELALGDAQAPTMGDFRGLMRYRAEKLWCPLLTTDGACSIYESRPMGCRFHVAVSAPRRCEHDAERPKGKFLKPQSIEGVSAAALGLMCENAPRALFEFDHLGVWLGHLLLGETRRSNNCIDKLVTQTDWQPL